MCFFLLEDHEILRSFFAASFATQSWVQSSILGSIIGFPNNVIGFTPSMFTCLFEGDSEEVTVTAEDPISPLPQKEENE